MTATCDTIGAPNPLPRQVIVGAYAAAGPDLDAADERTLLDGLLRRPDVAGLEIPYLDRFNRNGDDWLLARLGDHKELVTTLVGDTVGRLSSRPRFGLASLDADGRRSAVDVARSVRDASVRLADLAGRSVVHFVELQTAPRSGAGSSADALGRSLDELLGWDWAGARLVVEHCDAARPGRTAAKGFLELEAEIEVVRRFAQHEAPVGLVINWGRSAIEGGSALTPVEHVRAVREAGLLAGVVLSGCSGRTDARGGAWADVHLPPADPNDPDDPSLLDDAALEATLSAADACAEPPFIGLKISCPPAASTTTRLGIVDAALDRVGQAWDAVLTRSSRAGSAPSA
ncbi:DUF4862 family protein [Herbiconiux sp. CPCC 205763]|uniref:DUF4862 family protein n=1 Tax=Herbiconiux aconitum TaxID=2970913 RepID=A0ABT2GL28_9MICO|nr:DUF4862 family protein [Herbiconiux aconitum]MCS5716928.1 DUF4862 family protein [Herbiconiux aconitum]